MTQRQGKRGKHTERKANVRKDIGNGKGREIASTQSYDALRARSKDSVDMQKDMRDPNKVTSFSDFGFPDFDASSPTYAQTARPENVRTRDIQERREAPKLPQELSKYAPKGTNPLLSRENVEGTFAEVKDAPTSNFSQFEHYRDPSYLIVNAKIRIPFRPWRTVPEIRDLLEKSQAYIIEWAEDVMNVEKAQDKRFNQVRTVKKANIRYNCHAYTFTNSERGWVIDADAGTILAHLYKPVASYDGKNINQYSHRQIKAGDVIAYYNSPDQFAPEHTGVVVRVERNKITVRSKWGIFGLNEHPVDVLPMEYPKFWTVYHTNRPEGRLLQPDYDVLPTYE